MLCNACEKIFDSTAKKSHAYLSNRYMHHDDAYQIETATKAGCFICSTLWDRLTEEEKDFVRSEGAKKLQASTISDKVKHRFEIVWRRMYWGVSRFFVNPEFKQLMRPYEYNSYGWMADYERGLVVFSLGTKAWKEVAFMLLPDHGE
jgi:hypothetical protein